ncbi:MAG: arginase [Gammaproteobacteria bacterium]|nr:arginase [Gammaproteobacteria bacterium]
MNAQKLKKITTLIGVPTDIGSGLRGASMGPEAIRVAGLERALRNLGLIVLDKGNIIGPPNPEEPPVGGYRHLEATIQWCEEVRESFYLSLVNGELPILLGGDHSMAIGSIAGIGRYCFETGKKLNILWLDAHADFNTADTSPSGNIHGMPLAIVCGLGHPKFKKVLNAKPFQSISTVVQIGVRSIDTLEREQLNQYPIHILDMRMLDEHGMRVMMEKALNLLVDPGAHLHVSLDVDFLDADIAPGVSTPVKGGPSYREAQLCMEMIYDTGCLGSLDIMELNPAFDERNKTAELTVELVESLFGKQILARNPLH